MSPSETIEIIGENYLGHFNQTRTTCRAILLKGDKVLLSYETKTDQWMVPGGGVEEGETEEDAVIREVREETGFLIKPTDKFLEIDEFYEDFKYINLYFLATINGETDRKLTPREKEVGMEPRWLPVQDAIEIFSCYQDYAQTDEMRRGLYLRELTSLLKITNHIAP